MNCAFHLQNAAVASCNGCGRALCPACDHRIKGFPYCQECIVRGVELLRSQSHSNYAPYVKKKTSPVAAVIFSAVCPGLGAAYNGQATKAIVHFAVFVGLFQMAVLTSGMPLFVFGFIGMWLFAAIDSWRTAQMIRSGITADAAEDLLVSRFSGNPKLWGIVLAVLGGAFILQRFFNVGGLMKIFLPVLLIGLGIYFLRGVIFRVRAAKRSAAGADETSFALSEPLSGRGGYDRDSDFTTRSRFGTWRDHN
ncbi:MAG: hypothetical protein UZ17_ACD001001334 [Acidobacteria bacterium OLB17]|nr:MAG: hypothetical protein UZ17_ACD001001334 [Acidobacteria bacterium OLB17]MCZ2391728.1 hypothetical protein [Acidobacteriota bacterium]